VIAWVISLIVALSAPILLVRLYKRPLASFHRVFTNRIAVRFVTRLPGFGIVGNVGRRSGKLYRTPVNVFRVPGGFLIALTYGRESGWVENVLAAGKCEVETRFGTFQVYNPIVVRDASHQRFPTVVRMVLSLVNANDYLEVSLAR
jgi:deazaflavin-dependent oxidoreductase (nitroreductase family)